jgi:hypothetical protein
MNNGNSTDMWGRWWPRILGLTGLVIVLFIVFRQERLDPFLYPIIALMLGFPIAGWAEGLLRKGNGNGNGKT